MRQWASEQRRSLLAFAVVVVFLGCFAFIVRPTSRAHPIPGLNYWPDSADYIAGAVSLLHGHYLVTWDSLQPVYPGTEWGLTPHVPRYTPGMSLLLLPAIALGGVNSAAFVPYGAGLLLGVLAAWLAARLSGAVAAPLAVVAVLGTVGVIVFSITRLPFAG